MSEPMDLIYKDPKYPSSKVVNGLSMAGPRAHLRGMGPVSYTHLTLPTKLEV